MPSGQYFYDVLKAYGRTTRAHMDSEVKKRGCEDVKLDTSYKEPKHLMQHHGTAIFKGLVTGTNALGEVRMQFHVVSGSHEQMIPLIAGLKASLAAYNLPPPHRLATGKPGEDEAFFMAQFPSLQKEQDRLDALTAATANDDAMDDEADDSAATTDETQHGAGSRAPAAAGATASGEPECTIDLQEQVSVASTPACIDRLVDLMRAQLDSLPSKHRVLSLDAEWELVMDAGGTAAIKEGAGMSL